MIKQRLIVVRIGLIGMLCGWAIGLMLLSLHQPALARASEAEQPGTGLRIVASTEDTLLVAVDVSDYELRAVDASQKHYQQIVVSGTTSLEAPGFPELPKFSMLLGVPPEGRVSVRVLSDFVETLPGSYRLVPAESPAPPSGDLQPGTTERIPDRTAYASSEFYPAEVARVVETAWLRDQRLARIEIYPFQYLAAKDVLRLHRHLQIEIKFEGASTVDRMEAAPAAAGPFEQLLSNSLLNYETARRWRSSAGSLPIVSSPAITTPQYKIVVDRDSLYRVTYTDLLSAGLVMTSFDPRNLHLSNQGLPVAIEVSGEDDGQFDPTDYLLFYGQRLRGDLLASKHADEADDWIPLNGWQPQFNAKMVEKYTDENVYWLEVGTTPGLRITSIDGTPGDAPAVDYYTATAHAEQQNVWKSTHLNDEDTWFWDEINTGYTGQTITRTYTTTLSAIASVPFSAVVRAEITPLTVNPPPNPTYRTIFRLNTLSNVLEDTIWTGLVRHRLTVTTPVTTLVEGPNALTLTVVAQAQSPATSLYFDWFEIQYPRHLQAVTNQLTFSDERGGPRQYATGNFTTALLHVLDVSNPWLPQRVVSSSLSSAAGQYTATFEITSTDPVTYYVSGADQIRSPKQISYYEPPDLGSSNGADYVIITHRDFITSMQTLAAYRAGEGLRVKVIDVADLYNQFTDGLYHPIAIKDFLKYAYASWQPPAPTYVLLVGDGHWNFKNFNTARYGAPPNFMPPNLGWVDPYQGEVDTANELVELVGNDRIPDMLIGRLPVNTAAEADVVVSKIISYEAQAKSLPYRQRMMLVADNVPDPAGAGDFVYLSNEVINTLLPSTYVPDRIYANDYGCAQYSLCPQVNYAITSTLNQTGALFVNYIGHASINRWGNESYLVNANVATLNNLDRLPIILSMTCLDGYWIYPTANGSNNSLMEVMLRAANGGSVASFSPTGLGVSTGHDQLERGLLEAVFQQNYARLGWATQAGKLDLFATGMHSDLIDTFTIFGDPALRLPTYAIEVSPDTSTRYGSPNMTVEHTIYLTNTGLLTNAPTISVVGGAWPVTAVQPVVLSGQSTTLVVSVTIPLTAPLGTTDVATLTVRSGDDSVRATTILTTINGLYGIAAAPEPVSQQTDPGTTVTYTVQITNLGIMTDSYDLSLVGNAWPTQLSTANLIDVPPHSQTSFEVWTTVPAQQIADSTDVAHVVIASQGGRSGSLNAIVPVTTTVNAVYSFALAPLSQSRIGVSGQTLIYTLALTNTGNATNTFAVALQDTSWPTVISSTAGALTPWSSLSLPVQVSIPSNTGRDESDTAIITVTVSLGTPSSQTATLISTANPFQMLLPLVRKN